MNHPHDDQRKIKTVQSASEKEVRKRHQGHYQGTGCITFLSADPVYHIRDPGAAQDRRQSERSHYDTDVDLVSSMGRDKDGEKKKCAVAGQAQKIGCSHAEKTSAERHPITRSCFRTLDSDREGGVKFSQ
jgi:hypothetical protein